MEISPDGKTLRPRTRFAKFVNLPELQQMFRAFADVQTAEMLEPAPPRLEGGKPQIVACPMSDEQAATPARTGAALRAASATRRSIPREDNALAITTDGRKLALDARLLSARDGLPRLEDQRPGRERRPHLAARPTPTRGTQMVFCDMGVNPTPWGYSGLRRDRSEKLVKAASPPSRSPSSATPTPTPRSRRCSRRSGRARSGCCSAARRRWAPARTCRSGWSRLHHLDAPWKPAEVEQRDGRILRQGNENREVRDLPLRHRGQLRRLYVAGAGDARPGSSPRS